VREQSGVAALLLVVWIMVMLLGLVGEFSYSMRTELKITRNFKEEEEAYRLALAGIEKAKAELLSAADLRQIHLSPSGELLLKKEQPGDMDQESEPERSGELGRGRFSYELRDEDGKLNINKASREQIRYLLVASGVDSADADTIADSIIDWRDSDDLHMLNGAEEDYYRSLDSPYSCKDGDFTTIEELLLVRGMTKEILYGSKNAAEDEEPRYRGIINDLTVYGTGAININTASPVVLEAVFGTDRADDIIFRREAGPLLNPVGKSKVSSETFTIVSQGENADGSIKRKVKAVLQRRGNNLTTLYWKDNVI
jgi:general secretion pathway protein K